MTEVTWRQNFARAWLQWFCHSQSCRDQWGQKSEEEEHHLSQLWSSPLHLTHPPIPNVDHHWEIISRWSFWSRGNNITKILYWWMLSSYCSPLERKGPVCLCSQWWSLGPRWRLGRTTWWARLARTPPAPQARQADDIKQRYDEDNRVNTDSTNAPGSVRLDEAPRLSIKTEYIFGSDLFVKLNLTNS